MKRICQIPLWPGCLGRIAAWTATEAFAFARLRQCAEERIALTSGKVANCQRLGWKEPNDLTFDLKVVRVIDFTSARATLDADEQAALMLTYRDRERVPDVARAVGCTIRKISCLLPTARRELADVLSRLGLL